MIINVSELTVSQAAMEARVSGVTIRRWIAEGRLAARKIESGTYRIQATDLVAFLRRSLPITQSIQG
jgi:excisionase family DNA binding protein